MSRRVSHHRRDLSLITSTRSPLRPAARRHALLCFSVASASRWLAVGRRTGSCSSAPEIKAGENWERWEMMGRVSHLGDIVLYNVILPENQ